MARPTPAGLIIIGFVSLFGAAARAADADAPSTERKLAAAPPRAEADDADAAAAAALPPAETLAAQGARRPTDVSYGVAARLRWVSVPGWMLNLFTKRNVPLSSWATALEFFRRKGNFDFVGSIGYQNMSPSDGNWLGAGHDAAVDTDYVQFHGLAFIGLDASFVWHTMFNDWFGMHYGAGLGIGFVLGDVLRTSNGSGCTEANAGDLTRCHPVGAVCTSGSCMLSAASLQPGPDDPANPHRFADSNVPPVIPIINVVLGIDFRLPQVRGWEARIEGGFYDAFFLGGGVGYTF